MNITLQISDSQFEKISKNALQNITEDMVTEAIRQGIINVMSAPETLKRLLETRYSVGDYAAEKIISNAIGKIDLSPLFKDMQKAVIDYFKNNSNLLAEKYFMYALNEGLSKTLWSSNSFKEEIHSLISPLLLNLNNNHGNDLL